MQALIDPTTSVNALTEWVPNPDTQSKNKYLPVYTPIENSARVCEVVTQPFPVALPFFWVDCNNGVVPDQWYYNTQDQQVYIIPEPAPYPEPI